jgi:ferritin-like protein
MHRALVSLIEELEAVDWYSQRAENADDDELRATLIHHRDEEIEHAMMNLEWIRRNHPKFQEHMKTYLFTEAPIVDVEEAAKVEEVEGSAASPATPPATSLSIGSLRSE